MSHAEHGGGGSLVQRMSEYFALAGRLSGPELLLRAAGFAGRRIRRQAARALDALRPTYGGATTPSVRALTGGRWADGEHTLPAPVLAHHLAHRFDLLGSGWVEVAAPASLPAPGANARESARIRALIASGPLASAGYRPIDWSVDTRSGHHWSAAQHFSRVPITPGPGIDIKMPWEISRMQHLPQLALAAAAGQQRDVCVREVRAQILDFIAANPPRFGVDWACAMDVGIRVANWVVAVDILRVHGEPLDAPFLQVFARSVRDHARHLLANLEWSELPRSNHYLADIVGLMFAAAACASAGEADAEACDWLAFATREFFTELRLQFRDDGGCYEASSGYHRLSAEMAAQGVALLLGLEPELARGVAAPARRLSVRPPQDLQALPLFTTPDAHATLVPPDIAQRLARMAELALDLRKHGGAAVMIGDQDSGRFFKIGPVWRQEAGVWSDDALDHGHLIATVGVLLGRADLVEAGGRESADARLAGALARGHTLQAGPAFAAHGVRVVSAEPLPQLLVRLRADHDAAHRREWRIDLPPVAGAATVAAAYPLFGAYVLRRPGVFIALRCFDAGLPGVYGHSHDDNLALELEIAGQGLVVDPGTLAYTSDPAAREAYRSARAHGVPRVQGADAMQPVSAFQVRHLASARCLYFGPDGWMGRLQGEGWAVTRLVVLNEDSIDVVDACEGGPLAPPWPVDDALRVTAGYGKRTDRPVRGL